jgi:protein-tyrosine phosphatase
VIDTHCHLLPGLDDGAESEAEAIQMARRMSAEGVRTVVCTPHFSRRYPTSVERALTRLARLRTDLADLGIDLHTELAAEVSPTMALAAPAQELAARAIGGSFLLVELHPSTDASFLDDVLSRLTPLGLSPIFAHPERCLAIRRSPQLVDGPREQGALVQVLAPSLAGRSDAAVNTSAWSLVKSRRADLVASDAHRSRAVGLQLRAIRALIGSQCGDAIATRLMSTTPASLLAS